MLKVKKSLSAAHILNLNTVTGTITNDQGFFEITAKANDTSNGFIFRSFFYKN